MSPGRRPSHVEFLARKPVTWVMAKTKTRSKNSSSGGSRCSDSTCRVLMSSGSAGSRRGGQLWRPVLGELIGDVRAKRLVVPTLVLGPEAAQAGLRLDQAAVVGVGSHPQLLRDRIVAMLVVEVLPGIDRQQHVAAAPEPIR